MGRIGLLKKIPAADLHTNKDDTPPGDTWILWELVTDPFPAMFTTDCATARNIARVIQIGLHTAGISFSKLFCLCIQPWIIYDMKV